MSLLENDRPVVLLWITDFVLVGKVGKLRLERRWLAIAVDIAQETVSSVKGRSITTGCELFGVITQQGLFAGEEVVGRWLLAGGLDVGLGLKG